MKLHLLIVLSLTSICSVAIAQPDTSAAREHYRKATTAFELGAFDEAIREYGEAYRLIDDPAILYNLGQAHRLAQHAPEALHFYKMYLNKVPDAPNRAEVNSKIVALQQLIEQQKKAQSLQPDKALEPLPGRSQLAPPIAAASPPSPPPKKPIPPGQAKKIAGFATAAVGVAMVATGIAFTVLAKNAADDLTHLDQQMGTFDASKQSAGKTDQLVGGVLLGVGAAAAATGTALVLLGYRDSNRASERLSFAPLVGPSQIGFVAYSRF